MVPYPEYENVDNAQSTMPEYSSKLTQMYQYQNRSVQKFLRDFGVATAKKVYPNNAAAVNAGLKKGEFYVSLSGDTDLIVKIVK